MSSPLLKEWEKHGSEINLENIEKLQTPPIGGRRMGRGVKGRSAWSNMLKHYHDTAKSLLRIPKPLSLIELKQVTAMMGEPDRTIEICFSSWWDEARDLKKPLRLNISND